MSNACEVQEKEAGSFQQQSAKSATRLRGKFEEQKLEIIALSAEVRRLRLIILAIRSVIKCAKM